MLVTLRIDDDLFYSTEIYVDDCRQAFAEFRANEHFNLKLVEKTQWQPKNRRDALYSMIPRDFFKIAAHTTEWTVDAVGCNALQLSVSADSSGYILQDENSSESVNIQKHKSELVVEKTSKRAFLLSTVTCFIALGVAFLVLPIVIFPPALVISSFVFIWIALLFSRAWLTLRKAKVIPDKGSILGGVTIISPPKHKMILFIDGKQVISASEMTLPEKFILKVMQHRSFPDGYPGFEMNKLRENRMEAYTPPYAVTASCGVQGNMGVLKLSVSSKKGCTEITVTPQTGAVYVQDCQNELFLTNEAYRYFRKRAIFIMAACFSLCLAFSMITFVFGNLWIGVAASVIGFSIFLPVLLLYATYFRISKQALSKQQK